MVRVEALPEYQVLPLIWLNELCPGAFQRYSNLTSHKSLLVNRLPTHSAQAGSRTSQTYYLYAQSVPTDVPARTDTGTGTPQLYYKLLCLLNRLRAYEAAKPLHYDKARPSRGQLLRQSAPG